MAALELYIVAIIAFLPALLSLATADFCNALNRHWSLCRHRAGHAALAALIKILQVKLPWYMQTIFDKSMKKGEYRTLPLISVSQWRARPQGIEIPGR